jgi:predicted XRE-type DNA-binding protein
MPNVITEQTRAPVHNDIAKQTRVSAHNDFSERTRAPGHNDFAKRTPAPAHNDFAKRTQAARAANIAIAKRTRAALAAGHKKPGEGVLMTQGPAARDPARNIFLALGFPAAEEHFLKAELVLRLDKAMTLLGLTHEAAARRIGIIQSELSGILTGKFCQIPLERLMRYLTAFGHDIEIKIAACDPDKLGAVTIAGKRRKAPTIVSRPNARRRVGTRHASPLLFLTRSRARRAGR